MIQDVILLEVAQRLNFQTGNNGGKK